MTADLVASASRRFRFPARSSSLNLTIRLRDEASEPRGPSVGRACDLLQPGPFRFGDMTAADAPRNNNAEASSPSSDDPNIAPCPAASRPKPQDIHPSLAERQSGLSTHLRVWPASAIFLDWAKSPVGKAALGWAQKESLRLVELGSGRGWLGLSVADSFPGISSLLVTDLPDALQLLISEVEPANSCRKAENGNSPETIRVGGGSPSRIEVTLSSHPLTHPLSRKLRRAFCWRFGKTAISSRVTAALPAFVCLRMANQKARRWASTKTDKPT